MNQLKIPVGLRPDQTTTGMLVTVSPNRYNGWGGLCGIIWKVLASDPRYVIVESTDVIQTGHTGQRLMLWRDFFAIYDADRLVRQLELETTR